MSAWGKGGFVGINKAVDRHRKTVRLAELILEREHGRMHKPGTHELCPLCRQMLPERPLATLQVGQPSATEQGGSLPQKGGRK